LVYHKLEFWALKKNGNGLGYFVIAFLAVFCRKNFWFSQAAPAVAVFFVSLVLALFLMPLSFQLGFR